MTVLVVDDEVALARVVAGYLEREGFAVVQAHDGPTAVSLARTTLPALIVLDVMLPGFDGVEVCRQVRQF
ncbi:MAG: response regulator, partial [Ornithinibacter sp.]